MLGYYLRPPQILVGLPMMEINSRITGKRWVALPFTDHCSPLLQDKNDLEKLTINEIAIEIRKSMPDITNESYLEYLLSIETIIARKQSNKLNVYDPRSGCLVTNLSMLPANKLNFGSGDPDFIFMLTIEKNSAAILSNRDNYILRLAY